MPKKLYEKGQAHPNWKGEAAGYRAKHTWVLKEFGRPLLCEGCGLSDGNPRRYHWANLSGKYKRVRSDWKRLCVSCHVIHDGSAKKGRKTYTFRGETLRLREWAEKLGVGHSALAARIGRYGWSVEEALTAAQRAYEKRPKL